MSSQFLKWILIGQAVHLWLAHSGRSAEVPLSDQAQSCIWAPVGQYRYFYSGDQEDKFRFNSIQYSKDEQKIVLAATDNTVRLIQIDPKKPTHIHELKRKGAASILHSHKGPVSIVQFSPDQRLVVSAGDDRTVKIQNLRTKRQIEFQTDKLILAAKVSKDSRKIAIASFDKKVNVLRLNEKQEFIEQSWVINLDDISTQVEFSPDGRYIAAASKSGRVQIYEFPSQKQNETELRLKKEVQLQGSIKQVRFSPLSSKKQISEYFVAISQGGESILLGLAGFESILEEKSEHPWEQADFSPVGEKLFLRSAHKGAITFYDLKKKEKAKFKFAKHSIEFAGFFQGSDKMVLATSRGEVKIFDPVKKREILSILNDFNGVYDEQWDGLHLISHGEQVSQALDLSFHCYPRKNLSISSESVYFGGLQKMSVDDRVAFAEEYLQFIKKDVTLPTGDALIALKRNAFHVLQSLLLVSDVLYESFLSKYQFLLNEESRLPTKDIDALSKNESFKAQMLPMVDRTIEYTQMLLLRYFDGAEYNKWLLLQPLREVFSTVIHFETLNALKVEMSARIANAAFKKDSFIQRIPYGKVRNLAYNKLSGLIGKYYSPQPITGILIVRKSSSLIVPIIYSYHPIDKDEKTKTPYGFYFKKIAEVSIGESLKPGDVVYEGQPTWTVNDLKYSADIKLTLGESKELVDRSASLDYEAIWKNKKMSGIILMGSNIYGPTGQEWGYKINQYYKKFFEQRGYSFRNYHSKNPQGWLLDKVSSGYADYLVKEAHYDGDDDNLLMIDSESSILHGAKELSDGNVEEMFFIYRENSLKSRETKKQLFSSAALAEAFQMRVSNGGGPLFYLESSCYSVSKAINAIESIASPLFIPVASKTQNLTFSTLPGSAMKIILEGLYSGKSYPAIREELTAKNAHYRQGSEDAYMFPDEDVYEQSILNLIRKPISKKVVVYNSKGQIVGNPIGIKVSHINNKVEESDIVLNPIEFPSWFKATSKNKKKK